MNKEILAPAGDKDSFFTAVNCGADAIYLGLNDFSARKSAENFSLENLKYYIDYAHLFNVKIYVAMNTLIKDNEFESFLKAMISVHNMGADGIIVQDIFAGQEIKRLYPEIQLHLSTQGGCCNEYVALLAKNIGFTRVILSRETKIEDIKKIAKILPVESFVQGALCTCFSGQCYLSSFIGKNSGNRGHCKQPCRKKYRIDRAGFEELSYKISLADLCMGKRVFDLIDAGVTSFKIEGRMRRSEYVASAINYYRTIFDGKSEDEIARAFSDLKRTYNRGNYTKGLAFGQDKTLVYPYIQGHIGEKVGTLSLVAGKPFCKSKNGSVVGDAFKIIRNNVEVGSATTSVASNDNFFLLATGDLKEGDSVHITTDKTINDRLLSVKKDIVVNLTIELLHDSKARLIAYANNESFTYESEQDIQKALTRSITKDEVKACFNKVSQFPFEVRFDSIRVDEAFITKAQLNEYRRILYTMVFEGLSKKEVVQIDNSNVESLLKQNNFDLPNDNRNSTIILSDLSLLNAIKTLPQIVVYKPKNYYDAEKINEDILKHIELCKSFYLYTPAYASGDDLLQYEKLLSRFEGVYSDGIYAIELCKRANKKLFVGTGFNIFNSVAMNGVKRYNPEYICSSKELTNNQISKIIKNTNTQEVYRLSFGDIKLMDLIYCPFSKDCATCDKKNIYSLTDENERRFLLRRYQSGECRFELYNCVDLISDNLFTNVIFDFSTTPKEKAKFIFDNYKDAKLIKEKLVDFTYGYAKNEIY